MNITYQNETATIRPVGNLDINTSEALRKSVIEAFETEAKTLLIDCRDVTFLDSSGLSAMVMALKKARELNVSLSLYGLDEQAMMLFRLTGMNKVFHILEEAPAS